MATNLQTFEIRGIGVRGIIRQSSVDDYLLPEGSVTDVENMHFDRIGAATVRPGLANDIGGTFDIGTDPDFCVGLHNANRSALIVAYRDPAVSTQIFSVPDTEGNLTWSDTSVSGGNPTRFVDFGDHTLMIPYQGSPKHSTWPYRSVSTSGAPFNINQFTAEANASFGEVYKSRVYLAGDSTNPSRLFFSTVVNSAGSVSWQPTEDYVDINPGDGESITGLKRYSLELLVFKQNYTYRFRTSGLDPDPLIRVGTQSQESVIEGKRGVYFHHDSGFYRYDGSYPVEISRPIADIVDNIPPSQRDNVAAWRDSDHIYWTLYGDVTVPDPKGSRTWTNCVVRYTESSDVWTIYSYSQKISRGATFITGTTNSLVVALDVNKTSTNWGHVLEFNKGTIDPPSDPTTEGFVPINYKLVTRWYELEGIENRKRITDLLVVAEKGMGMNLMYQIDDYEDWITLPDDLHELTTLFRKKTKGFHRIRFKITGSSSDESAVFLGMKILRGINEGLLRNHG